MSKDPVRVRVTVTNDRLDPRTVVIGRDDRDRHRPPLGATTPTHQHTQEDTNK